MAHVSHLPLQRRTTPSSLPEPPLTAPSSPSSAPDLPYLIWKTLRVKCMWRGAVTPAPPPQQRVWVKGKVGSLPTPTPTPQVEPVFARELLLHSKLHGQVPRWRVPSPASPTASLAC